MNIGIIIYSQTGNTRAVAGRLADKIGAAGHKASLEEIKVTGDVHPGMKNIQFSMLPDASRYDAVVFGAQVMAFSLSPVMVGYLKQLAALQGKKVALLLTQGFPYRWMGGNRALNRMKNLCESKGAVICGTGVVNWMNKKRETMIADAVEKIGTLF
jgi:flavodoxin